MVRYFSIRIGRAMITIALVVTFAFVVLRLSGDPALIIMGPEAPPEVIAAFRKAWGLDDPIWMQYFDYFGAIAKGELGRSMRDGRPAIALVLERIPATLALTIPALSAANAEAVNVAVSAEPYPPFATPDASGNPSCCTSCGVNERM